MENLGVGAIMEMEIGAGVTSVALAFSGDGHCFARETAGFVKLGESVSISEDGFETEEESDSNAGTTLIPTEGEGITSNLGADGSEVNMHLIQQQGTYKNNRKVTILGSTELFITGNATMLVSDGSDVTF